MRKIKIRAWDKQNGVYIDDIFSALIHDQVVFDHLTSMWDICKMINDGDDSRFNFQQFIGVKDKHYRDIYEGDFVKIKGIRETVPISGTYEVFYKDTGFYLKRENNGVMEYEEFKEGDDIILYRRSH